MEYKFLKSLLPELVSKNNGIDNLWKYDLPKAWRLLYSIVGNEIRIIAIVIEWVSHKEDEKRFKY